MRVAETSMGGSRTWAVLPLFRSPIENNIFLKLVYCSQNKNEKDPFSVDARSHRGPRPIPDRALFSLAVPEPDQSEA